MELITSGDLPNKEYAPANKFFSFLWQARRHSPDPTRRGWRPWKINATTTQKFQWGFQNAIIISSIPSCVQKQDILTSLEKLTGGGSVQLISVGPSKQKESWKGLALLGDAEDVLTMAESKRGIQITSEVPVPHIEEEYARAKARFDQAEAVATVHQTEKNSLKKDKARSDLKMARLGLRGFSEYKIGHVHISRAHKGLRVENRPRQALLGAIDRSIEDLNTAIRISEKEMQKLSDDMERVTSRAYSTFSEKLQGMTSVEALQALQNGHKEETLCGVCQEPLGDSDGDGLVIVTQCGHLTCRHCLLGWKKQKQDRGERLTCIECRKPVTSTIVVDPNKVEDQKAVAERKNNAKLLVQEAAKKLRENGTGQLEPRLWEALYLNIELPSGVDRSRDRQFSAIPGEFCAHLRNATGMPTNSTPKCRNENPEAALSSKTRALLRDLPRNELSVVFTSSKSVLKYLLVVLETFDFGCRSLFTGQKEIESKAAIDDWHNDDKITVLVVQAGAAACGLTLTASRKLFLLEPFRKYEVRRFPFWKSKVKLFFFVIMHSCTHEMLTCRTISGWKGGAASVR
jgi:hypothetical protein